VRVCNKMDLRGPWKGSFSGPYLYNCIANGGRGSTGRQGVAKKVVDGMSSPHSFGALKLMPIFQCSTGGVCGNSDGPGRYFKSREQENVNMTNGRFSSLGLPAVMAAALLLTPFLPARVEAQGGGRLQILVVDMKPTDGTQPAFGERASNELRGLLDLDTHLALNERQTDQAARQFDLRRASLDCLLGRQLAGAMSVPLVFCGEYRTEGGQIVYDGAFYTVPDGEEFRAGEATVAANRQRDAAVRFRDFFNDTAERLAAISFCGQQYNSASWEGAVQYCTEAIALSPNSVEARKALGLALKELERYQESLVQLELVLQAQPVNSDILENAGWVATQIGETEKARGFYDRFLTLNPENTLVRIQIARELVEAEDEVGAVALLEGGFAHTADSTELVELHEQFGTIAFRAAVGERNRRGGGQPGPDGRMPPPDPEVARLFNNAIRSWEYVIDRRGPDAPPEYVRNSIAAYTQLQDYDRAVEAGRRGLGTFPRDALIMRGMAEAHQRGGNTPEAIRRMREALDIDPEIPNARAQMGQWLLSNRQADEAITWIHRAAAAGEQTPDNLASMLFGDGWTEGGAKGDFTYAIRMITAAKEVQGVSADLRSQMDFFHGYSLYSLAHGVLQQTATPQTCQQQTPRLQEALRVLPGGRGYAQSSGQDLQTVINATTQYTEMCAAIIQRGR